MDHLSLNLTLNIHNNLNFLFMFLLFLSVFIGGRYLLCLLNLLLLLLFPLFFLLPLMTHLLAGLMLPLLPTLLLDCEQILHPEGVVVFLVLVEQDVLELEVLAVEPRVAVIEFYHIDALLGRHEGRTDLFGDLLMGEQQLLHLHLALELTQIEQPKGDVMVLQLYLEVEEGILVVNLDYSAGGLPRIHPHALLDAQDVEGVHFSLGMADDRALPITIQQLIDPSVLPPDHVLQMPVPQLPNHLEEEHELVRQRKPGGLSGLLEGGHEKLSGLLGILDEEQVVSACAFDEFPHLVLCELEGEKMFEGVLAERAVVCIGPDEVLKGLVVEEDVLCLRALLAQGIGRDDDVVVHPRQQHLQQLQQVDRLQFLCLLHDLLDVPRHVVEVEYQFLILIQQQLVGMGQQDRSNQVGPRIVLNLLHLAHPEDQRVQHSEFGVVQTLPLLHAVLHEALVQQQLREGTGDCVDQCVQVGDLLVAGEELQGEVAMQEELLGGLGGRGEERVIRGYGSFAVQKIAL